MSEIILPAEIETIVIINEDIYQSSISSNSITNEIISNIENNSVENIFKINQNEIIENCCDKTSEQLSDKNASWLVIEKIAGENISALNAVRLLDENTIVKATSNSTYIEACCVGIALNAGITGTTIRVLILGHIQDLSLLFLQGESIFLGINGTLSNIAQSSGFHVIIGSMPANNLLYVNIKEPKII